MTASPPESAHPLELLRWHVEAGVDVALEDMAIDRFLESAEVRMEPAKQFVAPPRAPLAGRSSPLPYRAPTNPPPVSSGGLSQAALPNDDAVRGARELAAGAKTLEELRRAMGEFTGCNLRLTAKNLVFADGNPQAPVMFVGEAPGRDEDIQGLPFVGRSGQLLDRMIGAIGLTRETAYITNVISWRPPGNRTPTPQETGICLPFIARHIELVAPKILVCVGGLSASVLLNARDGILRLRGRWLTYDCAGKPVDAIAMVHPAYLLRNPAQKRAAWQDLLKIRQRLVEQI